MSLIYGKINIWQRLCQGKYTFAFIYEECILDYVLTYDVWLFSFEKYNSIFGSLLNNKEQRKTKKQKDEKK